MPNVKVLLRAALLVLPASSCFAGEAKLEWLNSLKDVQLYLKPKYDFVRTFDQEFGIQATVLRYGNFAAQTNLCYDPTYPIKFDSKPRYSLGLAMAYFFEPMPLKLGIYTKPKYNLVNTWKEETGITCRLYTSPSLVVSTNAAYVFTYPYISGAKPNWLGLVNFQFPLGR